MIVFILVLNAVDTLKLILLVQLKHILIVIVVRKWTKKNKIDL